MKDIIVMCPTLMRAYKEFCSFCTKYNEIINKKKKYEVILIDGRRVMFKAETEGQRGLLGTHADIVTIDEFEINPR